MKLPKTIDIFGEKYKIKLQVKPKCGGEETEGYINFNEKVIYIDKSMDFEKQVSTVYHEGLHGLLNVASTWFKERVLDSFSKRDDHIEEGWYDSRKISFINSSC